MKYERIPEIVDAWRVNGIDWHNANDRVRQYAETCNLSDNDWVFLEDMHLWSLSNKDFTSRHRLYHAT